MGGLWREAERGVDLVGCQEDVRLEALLMLAAAPRLVMPQHRIRVQSWHALERIHRDQHRPRMRVYLRDTIAACSGAGVCGRVEGPVLWGGVGSHLWSAMQL